MINSMRTLLKVAPAMLPTMLACLLSGCATQKIDWNARVGSYTYDQSILDYGPPDKHAKLEDGSVVAEWLTHRGYNRSYVVPSYYGYYGHCYSPVFPTIVGTSSPDYYLRLAFDSDGRLKAWKKFTK